MNAISAAQSHIHFNPLSPAAGKAGNGLKMKKLIKKFTARTLAGIFPQLRNDSEFNGRQLEQKCSELLLQILLRLTDYSQDNASVIIRRFNGELPEITRKLFLDAEAILEGDPAARDLDEVILSYPGIFAIAVYRIAHEFYRLDIPLLPRMLTEYAHRKTAIDIHPGAEIGESFAIDHGTGIVIGESTVIGRNVKMYHGVTLGAVSVDKKLASKKRHPTIEDNVVIYSNAVILGGKTVIGKNSIIGGNVWLTKSVPPDSIVSHHQEPVIQSGKSAEVPLNWII